MLQITNLTTNKFDEAFLNKVVSLVLEKENKNGTISLVFVGPNRMRKLNCKYRKKNKMTDVLSFPQTKVEGFVEPETNFLGEIVICPRAIKKLAKRENLDYQKELIRTLIHGILHLLGYNHIKKEEAEEMKKKEETYLKLIFK